MIPAEQGGGAGAMTPALSVCIAGAGVAGLAAARALALRGASVGVVEQAPEMGEVGAGLQVGPNGATALRHLGLWEAVADAGLACAAVVLRDGLTGRVLSRLDLAGRDWRLLHRADLLAVLAEGAVAAGAGVATGQRVAAVDDGALRLADGAIRRADLVIGADGLTSLVRGHLNGAAAPVFTGQVAWRALVPGDGGAAEAQVFMAPGRHLVTYPLRGHALRNIVAVEERAAWTDDGWSQPGDPQAMRAAFAGFGGPVRDWLAAAERCWLWGLFRHPVAPVWQRDGVAILGDAAHPTLPFLAQGANLALEDAVSLGAHLDRGGLAALPAWEAVRRRRAARVVAGADANARLYHARGLRRLGLQAALRLAGLVAPQMPLRRFEWIYAHDAGAVTP
jgi:salicylate hydroxylase